MSNPVEEIMVCIETMAQDYDRAWRIIEAHGLGDTYKQALDAEKVVTFVEEQLKYVSEDA